MTNIREMKAATPARTVTKTDPAARPSVDLAKRLVELTRPLHDRFHVKRIDEEAKTKGV